MTLDIPKLNEYQKTNFFSKVDKSKDCWEWQARRSPDGYGEVGLNHKRYLAHRVSYSISNGYIPQGMFVCHKCDNPPCVNPDHLFLGTADDNMKDMVSKGRAAIQTNLKKEDVLYIYGKRRCLTREVLSKMFNISSTIISNIWTGYLHSNTTGKKYVKGENFRIHPVDVTFIYKNKGIIKSQDLADHFRVSRPLISMIWNKRIYKDIIDEYLNMLK
ncbi:MAG: HNH endonuclease [Nanoarchaeota archaeon]|nr:HNH endonuclease [Nanoarchaeota archaeon]